MKAYVEGYGCSLNHADTGEIKGFLADNDFSLVFSPEQADIMVINTCAVKVPTEFKMVRRISELKKTAEENNSVLIVCGCLKEINPDAIPSSKRVLSCGPSLKEFALLLGLPPAGFSPLHRQIRCHERISIIPISRGCLGECSFCAVKNARGTLESYSLKELKRAFEEAAAETKEIWLTAQDCGCYGFDAAKNLVGLLSLLLETEGEYRVRIGMINPLHLLPMLDEYLRLFKDERLYRFFHVPMQSGSDKILSKMNRHYAVEDFLAIVRALRSSFKEFTLSTDVIVGFPGESEADFQLTVEALKKAKPYITNISRYGERPNTAAESLSGKIIEREKKRRSRALTGLCSSFSLEQNQALVGKRVKILVSEKGSKGNFVGRTNSYKQIVVKENRLGSFCSVKLLKAHPTYLEGMP